MVSLCFVFFYHVSHSPLNLPEERKENGCRLPCLRSQTTYCETCNLGADMLLRFLNLFLYVNWRSVLLRLYFYAATVRQLSGHSTPHYPRAALNHHFIWSSLLVIWHSRNRMQMQKKKDRKERKAETCRLQKFDTTRGNAPRCLLCFVTFVSFRNTVHLSVFCAFCTSVRFVFVYFCVLFLCI
jgi:hypothetical protein